MANGYKYYIELPSTAISAAKTLIQIKAGAAPLDIIEASLSQVSKTSAEMLEIQWLRKSAAATVTSFTPLKMNPGDPTALCVGGTSATGYNASAEGTNSDIITKAHWNVVNAEWYRLPVPEGRIRVPQSGIVGLKLNTAPAASMTFVGYVIVEEVQ